MAFAESAGLGPDGTGLMSAAGRPPSFIHHRHAALQPTESHGAVLCSALTEPLTNETMRIADAKQQPIDVERVSRIEGSASTAAAFA